MDIVENSYADLICRVVLKPNDIEWSDLDGIEMHEANYIKPSYETMEFLNKNVLHEKEINYFTTHKLVPSFLKNLIIWSQNFTFIAVESRYSMWEYYFIRIARNPVFDY